MPFLLQLLFCQLISHSNLWNGCYIGFGIFLKQTCSIPWEDCLNVLQKGLNIAKSFLTIYSMHIKELCDCY